MEAIKQKEKTKREKRLPGADTALMKEIAAFLSDFELKPFRFIEFMIQMEEYHIPNRRNSNNSEEDENVKVKLLDRGNCAQYFNSRSVPLINLLKIGYYLEGFECELDPEDIRLDKYQAGAAAIKTKIIEYVLQHRNAPKYLRTEIRNTLSDMADQDIKNLFQSLYIFTISERVWTFWACYCCLDCMAQERIKQLLSSFPITPQAYVKELYAFHMWEMEVNAPIISKFKKYYERYEEKQDRKKYIENLVELLQKYPYAFQDAIDHFSERALQRLNTDDWSIVAAYSLVCSALETEEQIEVDQTMMEYLSDNRNWRCLKAIDWSIVDFDNPPEVEKVSDKVVNYYMNRFREFNAV